jgi:phosphatidylserine synthase
MTVIFLSHFQSDEKVSCSVKYAITYVVNMSFYMFFPTTFVQAIIFLTCVSERLGQFLALTSASPTEIFRGLPHSLQSNSWTVSRMKPLPLYPIFSPNNFSLIILQFYVTLSNFSTAYLSKTYINKAYIFASKPTTDSWVV